MKKIIGIVSVFLLPMISFAQGYMMDSFGRGYNYNFGVADLLWIMLVPFIWFCVFISVFIFWLIMLIDAIKHAPEKTKMIWVIVIIFTHIIGALVYYFVEKKNRHKSKAEEKKEN